MPVLKTETGAMNETYPDYQPATLDQNVRQAISHALDRTLLAEGSRVCKSASSACLLLLSRRLR